MHPASLKLQSAISFLFHLLIFLLPFIWTSRTSELFEFPKMLTVYVFTLIIVVIWLARMVIDKKLYLERSFLDLPLLLFFTSQLVATIFSIDRHTSLWGYYSRFHGGFMSTLSYVLLYLVAVSSLTSKNVTSIIKTMLISAMLTAFYAFLEHFGYSASCLIITGQFDVACWVQDVQTRVYSTFGQPNWLAAYLITISFIPLSQILKISKGSSRLTTFLLPVIQLSLFFLTLLFTKSRSGFLGFAVGLIIFILLYFIQSRKLTLSTKLRQISLVSAILAVSFLFFGHGALPQTDALIFNRFTQAPAKDVPSAPAPAGAQLEIGGTESSKIRSIVWKGALALWQRYPLFGSGVETFAYGYYNVRPAEHNLVSEWDFLYNKAHNEFLNFLSTTGLFGFLGYLSLIFGYTLWTLKKIFTQPTQTSLLPTALLSGFLALAVSNFFGFSTVPVALLFFLFPAFAQVLETKNPLPVVKAQTLNTVQTSSLFLISLVAGFLIFNTLKAFRADLAYNQARNLAETGEVIGSVAYYQKAIKLVGNEPLYQDSLALSYAQIAASLKLNHSDDKAQEFADNAINLSNQALNLNKVHLNFYKTRARIFIALTGINPEYVVEAQKALVSALRLSPTDAKLWYNLGLIYDQVGQPEQARLIYEKTIELKPNYEAARMSLAALYEASGAADLAADQYRYILERINPLNDLAKQKIR